MFNNFVKESHTSDLSFKIRDLDSLTIVDSYFGSLKKSDLEIFNVPSVFLMHSEFHYCKKGFLVANTYVKNITINDCLLEDGAISLLSNQSTKVTKKCSMSPLSYSKQNIIEDDCQNSVIGRWVENQQGNQNAGVETTGVVMLALVCSAMLTTVVLVLVTAQKHGKLDAYL